MKKVLVALIVACAAAGAVRAQNPAKQPIETLTITEAKQGETLPVLLQDLHKDLPATAVQDVAFFMPSASVDSRWVMQLEGKAPHKTTGPAYTVVLTDPQVNYTATYAKNGQVLSCTELMKNPELPGLIREAIREDFPNWRLVGNQERITFNKALTTTYRVELAKGNEHESVLIKTDANGVNRVANVSQKH